MTTLERTVTFRFEGPESDVRAVIGMLEKLGADIRPGHSAYRREKERGVYWRGQFAVPADAPTPPIAVCPRTSKASPRSKQGIVDAAAQRMRGQIGSRELLPGARLPNAKGDRIRSRTYRMLVDEGLVEYVPGYGFYVAGVKHRGDHDIRAEAAANALRSHIMSGALPPGTKLVASDLVRQLRTTRGAVAAALATLSTEKLVVCKRRKIAYVAGDTSQSPPITKETQVTRAIGWIQDRIDSGTFTPGTKLPTRNRIATMARVGEATVQEAQKHLKETGAICFLPGKGTFVCGAAPQLQPSIQDQIISHVKAEITNSLPPGAKVPGYAHFRETFNVTAVTINRAFTRMKADGLLESRGSRGVFVADSPQVAALRDGGAGQRA